MPEFRELAAGDSALLHRFYKELYLPQFPDPDERESLANIERYLRLKEEGWYGRNNYHVTVVLDQGAPIAGAISDYLAEPNAGMIEFLVVAAAQRRRGLGAALLRRTEAMLDEDARMAAGSGVAAVLAEIEDPFRVALPAEGLDPFRRALIWAKWGYRRLDFPYVQPALSEAQGPVRYLMLAIKPLLAGDPVPAPLLRSFLQEYLRWAMRIDAPDRDPSFRGMARCLAARPAVPTMRLDAYVGRDPARPLVVTEVTGEAEPDFAAALAVYRAAFPAGAAAVEPAGFAAALRRAPRSGDGRYHLWALRREPEGPVLGMASFFAFPCAGFGGYAAFAPGLRGTGRLPLLLARIEERMRRDAPEARGWYIECETAAQAAIFRKTGFHELAIDYVQPPLPGGGTVRLALLYKPFGRGHEPPALGCGEFLDAVEPILRVVYDIAAPRGCPFFAGIERQLRGLDRVPFR